MERKKVVIIDYGLGNLFSIGQAILKVGRTPIITAEKKEILTADYVILPGVGAFGNAMESLARLDLISPISDYIDQGKPLMGICLGMQILFEESEEFGTHKGLGIIKGKIKRFPQDSNIKVPQTGWNQIHQKNPLAWESSPLKAINNQEYMYFVHSYYAVPEEENVVLSTTHYAGIDYCSSVRKNNVFAFQFHPEKSGSAGLLIYKEFIK